MSQGLTGQSKWTYAHKAKNPQDESRRKERQRQKEEAIRVHIKRNFLYNYGIPASIDQNSDVFRRVRASYLEEAGKPVEIVEEVR